MSEEEIKVSEKRGWTVAAGIGLLALLVYSLTLADYAFPGESAAAITAWTGMDVLKSPLHPVWGAFVRFVGGLSFPSSLVVRVNMFSLVCGVLSALMVCRLVRAFVLAMVSHEDVAPKAGLAADVASLVAGAVFVFGVPVWQASTHLECRIFDVMFALAMFSLLPFVFRNEKLAWPLAMLAAVMLGVGAVESVIFLPLAPIMGIFVFAAFRGRGRVAIAALGAFALVAAVSFALYTRHVMQGFAATPYAMACGESGMTPMEVAVDFWRQQTAEVRSWYQRPAWLCVMLTAVLPFVACGFAAIRGLSSERSMSQYVFHLAMTACVIAATMTPASPNELMRLSEKAGLATSLPVAMGTISAITAGYLAAYWMLLWRVKVKADEFDGPPVVAQIAKPLGATAIVILFAAVFFGSIVNAFKCGRDRGEFADLCAAEVLDRLGDRNWFVTQGILDDHLRILADVRGMKLNLVCLQREDDESYLKDLGAKIAEAGLKSTKGDLKSTSLLGVLPFVQDWFAGDPDVNSKAAVFGIPDFWYIAQKTPVPDGIFFTGVNDVKSFDGKKAFAEFLELWKRMEKPLFRRRGESLAEVDDPVSRVRLHLRRHLGFVGNNLGVTLQDIGMDDEAFQLYELVRKTIDPDNVCALFNEFEMARSGVKSAVARKGEIEKEIQSLVDNPDKRYKLWSLSRFYGYIRSPEIFARMGYGWARSGQTGAAITQVRRALPFVPADRQSGLGNIMAAIYAMGGETQKSRDAYMKVLDDDGGNRDALLGLARLAMQSGSLDEARDYMTKAVDQSPNKETSNVEWAIIHLMNNDLDQARLYLQKATDLNPNDLQAWGLLSHVMLQQADAAKDPKEKGKIIDDLESVIIPRMEKIAGGPHNYFVQVSRALVLLQRGNERRKDARDALLAAFNLRPEVTVVANMVLQQDIALDDKARAREHARLVLRQDRKNQLANYVLGSLHLGQREYGNAETFLRLAVSDQKPFAAAENDLAEVLRREGHFEEAEHYANKAVTSDPELYVAWETYASTLIDQNKDLGKAEEYLRKAIDLCKKNTNQEDPRMQITLVKVLLKNGKTMSAKGTLRSLQSRRKELSDFDLEELDKVAAEAAKAK